MFSVKELYLSYLKLMGNDNEGIDFEGLANIDTNSNGNIEGFIDRIGGYVSKANEIFLMDDRERNLIVRIYEALFFLRALVKEKKNPLIVPITRKGYWLYKLLCKCVQEGWISDVECKSDRYITKSANLDWLRDKDIILLDDTITHGDYLYKLYNTLSEKMESDSVDSDEGEQNEFKLFLSRKVTPFVFFINSLYDKNDEKRARFNSSLLYGEELSPDDMSKWCIDEISIFQRAFIPYHIDIPLITFAEAAPQNQEEYSDIENENTFLTNTVILQESDFQCIQLGARNWTYVDYTYNIDGRDMGSGLCFYEDSRVWDKYSHVIQNMVVKIRYDVMSDKSYKVAFTPFVILKSMNVTEMLKLFDSLYYSDNKENNVYYDYFHKYILGERLELENLGSNVYLAMYKAVVYRLCLYVWSLFSIDVLSCCEGVKEKNQELSITLLRDNSDEYFIKDTMAFWDGVCKKADNRLSVYMDLIMKLNTGLSVGKECDYEPGFELGKEYKKYSHTSMLKYVNSQFIKQKRKAGKEKNEADLGKVIYSIEDLVGGVDNKYLFDSKQQKRTGITEVIVKMLDMSIISSQLDYDSKTGLICRGFKAGENSDLVFFYPIQYIYSGVLAFYDRALKFLSEDGSEELIKKYYSQYIHYILKKLDSYFERKSFYGLFLEKEDMEYATEYFVDISNDLRLQMENKRFLHRSTNELQKYIYDYIYSLEI